MKRAYRRDFLTDLRFDTTLKAGEDYLFNNQVFLRSHSYRYVSGCLYNYNVANEQSAMNTDFAENFGHQLLASSKVEMLLKERGLYEVHKKNLRRRYYWCIREICLRWLSQGIRSPRRRRLACKLTNHQLKKGL
ncbi:MAG: hypothetical protein J6I49_07140 [Bacteroidales bacterium]|nr:hypothetical protein [Bacteroidales bacterium]